MTNSNDIIKLVIIIYVYIKNVDFFAEVLNLLGGNGFMIFYCNSIIAFNNSLSIGFSPIQ